MAKMDLGRFLETAGAMFSGQMAGQQQGQQLLQKQQQQDYEQQVQALQIRQQAEKNARESAFNPYELALKYTKNLSPEGVATITGAAGRRMDQAARDPFGGSGLDVSKFPANVRPFYAAGPAPAAPPPQPQQTQPDPAELHRQGLLQTLKGIAPLIPGGTSVLGRAIVGSMQNAPPDQASAAMGSPYEPPRTVSYPGLGPGGQPLTAALQSEVSDKDKALLHREAHDAYAANEHIPVGHPSSDRANQLLALANREDTSTLEGLQRASGYYRQVQALGGGVKARNPAEIAADTKILTTDVPKQLKGTPLNENTVGGVLAQLDNAVKMEDTLNTEREGLGRPAVSKVWGALKDKVNGAVSAYQQGNVPEAMRLAGQVMDATAFQQMKPAEQTRAMQGFFAQVNKTDPSQLGHDQVLAMAGAFGVRDKVEEMVRSGTNFASGPAMDRLRKLLPQVKNFTDLDPESQKLLTDMMIPLAKLSGQKLDIPARFVKQMTPAQKDASARGWANLRFTGDRVEIARGNLAIADSLMRLKFTESETKLKQLGSKGLLTESAAMQTVRGLMTDSKRTFEKAMDAVGLSPGTFDPTKPPKNDLESNLGHLYRDWQNKLQAVKNLSRQYGIDPDTGKTIPRTALIPGGRFGGSINSTTTRANQVQPPANVPGLGSRPATPTAAASSTGLPTRMTNDQRLAYVNYLMSRGSMSRQQAEAVAARHR